MSSEYELKNFEKSISRLEKHVKNLEQRLDGLSEAQADLENVKVNLTYDLRKLWAHSNLQKYESHLSLQEFWWQKSLGIIRNSILVFLTLFVILGHFDTPFKLWISIGGFLLGSAFFAWYRLSREEELKKEHSKALKDMLKSF